MWIFLGLGHFFVTVSKRNKKNQTQTIGPSPSKLNRPEASMIPILKPPSNYLVSNDQVPTRNSNSETNQSISQLDNDNGNKPPYQFPLKEYTQEILNMTKFTKIENSSSTYFAPEDLYKPSILQQPNKIYNKTNVFECFDPSVFKEEFQCFETFKKQK